VKSSESTGRPRPGWNRLQIVGLQTRLTAPYLLLTLLLALLGTYIVTQLVTSSIRERFDNQLLEASRAAADGIVEREGAQLAVLRLMAFTQGLPEALAGGQADRARDLLWPLVLNNKVESLSIVSVQGRELLTLARQPGATDYLASRGADFSTYDLVRRILLGSVDSLGDKYCQVLPTAFGPYIFTSAPVRDSNNKLVGVLLVGSRLEGLLAGIKAQALADVAVLDPAGRVSAASLAQPPEGFGAVALSPEQAAQVSPAFMRDLTLFSRSYKAVYSPLVVRGQPVGLLAVLLSSDYVFETGSISRNWFTALFALGALAVLAIGFVLARGISQPILRLRSVSQAVAAGDLDQTVGLERRDEIGDLASAFDVMTVHLRQRTAEAAGLYAETVRRNRELADINAKLQSTQQLLVQSEKLADVGQLTAGIVHDVKNPLAVVIGILDELKEDQTMSPEERADYLKTVRDNAWRANTIVTDLMKFARQSTPEMKRQNLTATVETALRLTDYLVRKAKIQVSRDLPRSPVLVNYDAAQIEQVLVNLIQNAVQATPEGGRLRVVVSPAEESVAIAVQDTGAGISPQNLTKIFDPFFTTKPAEQGTGLGLSVSYGIVARHGGRIDVASQPGQGATFTVLLPAEQRVELPAGEPAEQPAQLPAGAEIEAATP
jgi:signal transduction histidine kinase